eukprot:Nitzschia sp. Nitz4//scaffold53_size117307//25868//28369//NITZ4_003760-RA/size117307-processed-gene-0.5-mRNA-1//1//CDS//3329554175//8812//frame0
MAEDHSLAHDPQCLVCYSDLKLRAKTPCEHDDICGMCHLKVRSLHTDKRCPMCKTENERIIVDTDPDKRFQDYTNWGDDLGPGFVLDEDSGIFFAEDYYHSKVRPLFALSCHQCDFSVTPDVLLEARSKRKKTTAMQVLQEHLKQNHKTQLCTLCVDHKRDFVDHLPRLTQAQLQTHLRTGDGPDSGFYGHPVCELCKPKRFYDLTELYRHLHKDHYKCDICCNSLGLDHQYFKDYSSLSRHFESRHFLCRNPMCLEAKFIVFPTDLDLKAHELSVHGATSSGSNSIQLEFRTRRAGYDGSGVEHDNRNEESAGGNGQAIADGEAFVPPELPTSNANNGTQVQLHPTHLERTEQFKAQAALLRQQLEPSLSLNEAFPSLAPATGASAAPLTSWTAGSGLARLQQSRNRTQVTDQDFPSLGPAPSTKPKIKGLGNTNVAPASRRQFAAMAASASQPTVPASAGWSAPAPAPTPSSATRSAPAPTPRTMPSLTSEQFPSLGPSPNAPIPYTAANQYAKNMKSAPAPSYNNVSDFPTLGVPKQTKKQQPKKAPAPSINSASDFPTLGGPSQKSNSNQQSVRNKILGNKDKQPSQQAKNNILQVPKMAPPDATARATVDELKGVLGANKFKQLKRLTRELAEGTVRPDAYVDHAAALFQKGYGDPDFLEFLPALLDSCPFPEVAEQALIYLTGIQQVTQEQSRPATFQVAAKMPVTPSWGGNSQMARENVLKAPPAATRTAPMTMTKPVAPVRSMNQVISSKKKSAWGGPGNATVVKAKASPASVAAAAANLGPQGGTATKFMAKQAKQQNAANNTNNSKPKKKKQNDELRALAFGI